VLFLKKLYSTLEIWQHPIFQSSEYSEFEKLLLHTMKSGVAKNPVNVELGRYSSDNCYWLAAERPQNEHVIEFADGYEKFNSRS